MAAARTPDLTRRYQFRLDPLDPQHQELIRRLNALPAGKRNAFIVKRLIGVDAGVDPTVIKDAMREVLLEFQAASPQPAAISPQARPPDDLFNTGQFK